MKKHLGSMNLGLALLLLMSRQPPLLAQGIITVSGHVIDVNRRPISGVKVTANAAETTVTDSNGIYYIALKIAPGLPISFHLERSNYSALDEIKSVSPSLPTDFTLQALKVVSPQAALISLHKALNAIDKPYRELDCQSPPCPTAYQPFPVGAQSRTNANGELEAIDFVHQGGAMGAPGSVFGTISLADISKLSPEQRVLILVYEEGVTNDYALWSGLSSRLRSVPPPPRAEQISTAGRLVVVGEDMCGNFGNLLEVLQDINIQVWDHYWGIKSVCDRFSQSHIGG